MKGRKGIVVRRNHTHNDNDTDCDRDNEFGDERDGKRMS